MAEYSYNVATDITSGKINVNILNVQLKELQLGKEFQISVYNQGETPNDLRVFYAEDLDAGDKTTLDASIASHDPDGLWWAKHKKSADIDRKTEHLISHGFTFKGETISLSTVSQTNITNIYMIRNEAFLTYPIEWNTMDDQGAVTTDDAAEVETMYTTALGTVRGWRDSGTALKNQVRACTTVAEVEAIVDNR